MKFFRSLLFRSLFITIISGCSIIFDEKNTIQTSISSMKKNQFGPSIVWKISVGNGIGNFYSILHPEYLNNMIYVADRKGIVKSINSNNGKELWSINLAKKRSFFYSSSALLSGGISAFRNRIYIGSEKAQVYALDSKDGSIIWQAKTSGEVLSHPVVVDGKVLVHTSNGQLLALDEIDGSVQWIAYLGNPVFSIRGESDPIIVFDSAIIGSDNGYINAISIRNGHTIWRYRIAQTMGFTEVDSLKDVDANPILVNDTVYTVAYNGSMVALDLKNRKVLWKRNIGSIKNFIINNDCIYLVDQNNQILALNTENGIIIWKQNKLMRRPLTEPVLYNGNLVVGDSRGYIHWINPVNGCLLAYKKINHSGFLTKPIVVKDKLLIQARNGIIYAIKY